MSIASKLTKLETDITNAYSAVQTKGGTIPSNKNTNNLATAINSISGGGGKPEQSKTATPSTSSQTILPDEGYTLSSVTVNAVTSSIDSDIKAENIKKGVSILGVEGTMESAESLIDKTITKATVPALAGIVRGFLFMDCAQLEEVTIESGITTIETYAFRGCSKLTNFTMPDTVTTLGSHSFDRCSNLESIELSPNLTTLSSSTFVNDSKLTILDIPSGINSIGSSVFSNCSRLNTIILRSNTLCTLAGTNAFSNSPFRTTAGGTIYVPSALISQYENATNWSSLTATFVAIEGSEYE